MEGTTVEHCETCGQELPENHTTGMWLGDTAAAAGADRADRKGSGTNRRVLAGMAGLVLLWAAVIFVGRVVAPDDAPADEVAQEADPTAEIEEPTAQSTIALPTNEDLTDPGLPDQHNFVTRRIAMNNVQVERMQRHLERRDSSPTIAYRAAEGIAFVHLSRGVAEVAAVVDEGRVEHAHRILRSNGLSFAIDTETLVVGQAGDDASLVVSETGDGATYFVESGQLAASAPTVQTSTDGAELNRIVAPAGHQLIPFDGLGLLAISKAPTGGTQLARANSFEPLSEHRVLTANAQAMLEQVCESPLVCKLAVTKLASGEQWDVPPSFGRLGDTYYLSPDGGSLLRVTPEGFAEAYVGAEESVAWIIGQGMKAPAWGDQSNYIVWLDLVGEPNIKLMFVDDRDWLSIDLSALDAPLPVGPEFLIFEDE